MSMAINTAQIVSYKMKLQNAADLASYAGATVMARYMTDGPAELHEAFTPMPEQRGNMTYTFYEPNEDIDTIAELNKAIMTQYLQLLQKITALQCSTEDADDPIWNCRRSGGCDESQSAAKKEYADLINDYLTNTENLRLDIEDKRDEMLERAKLTAQKTAEQNLRHIDDYEVYVKISKVEFEPEEIEIFGSTYNATYSGFPPQCFVESVSANANSYCLTVGGGKVLRRNIFKMNEGNGYVMVGVIKKEDKSGVDYINWMGTFGKRNSPLFQAWSAASPIRNVGLSKTMDVDVAWGFAKMQNGDHLPNGVQQGRFRDQFNYIYMQSRASHSMVKEIKEGSGNRDEGRNLVGASANAFNETTDPLFYPDPPMRVRYVPLSGDEFTYEETGNSAKYYGSDNPLQGDLSKAVFGYLFSNSQNTTIRAENNYVRKKLGRMSGGTGAEYAYKIFGH